MTHSPPILDIEKGEISLLNLDTRIGGGTFADVFKFKGNAFKALKQNSARHGIGEEGKLLLIKEMEAEARFSFVLQHPNLVKVVGISRTTVGIHYELCRWSVLDYVMDKKRKGIAMPLEEKLRILKQLVAGVEYLHASNVIHRDLKPDNMLINADG